MSSILKALKKIETETSPFAGFQLNETQIDSRKVITARVKRVRLVRKISSFLCIAFILAVCGWVWVRYYPWMRVNLFARKPPKMTPAQLKVDNPTPQEPIMLPPEVKTSRLAANAIKTENRIDRVSKTKPSNPSRSAPRDTSHSKPEQAMATVKSQPLKSDLTVAKVAAKRIAAPTHPATQKENSSTAEEKPAVIQSLNDSKFTLQAIAWSPETHQRMAVVNGRILHEGDSIDGFLVAHIRQAEVILSEGGTFWRIEFRLKTNPK